MPRREPLYDWIDQVVDAFPHLSRPQATVLALYSFGMMLARRCGLNRVTIALVPLLKRSFATVRSRLQEFYQEADAKSGAQRRQLDVTTCFAPLLAWVLKGWPSTRLALALDATSLGATASSSCRCRSSTAAVPSPSPGRSCPPTSRTPGSPSGSPCCGPSGRTARRLDRGRDDRPRLVRALAVSGDRRAGLASPDADHAAEQVPQDGRASNLAVRRWCPSRVGAGRAAAPPSPASRGDAWNAPCWRAGSRGTRGPGSW